MPTPHELYRSGDLSGAIEALTQEVKADPLDPAKRTFLFELLAFAGQWDRAAKQIDVVANQSTQSVIGVQVYRQNIEAEKHRVRLFTEGLSPHFLTEPPPYVDRLLQAVNRIREGNLTEAREILDRVEEDRPAVSGKLNGEPFADLRDADDLFGPVLELIVKGEYAWLAFEQIRSLEIEAPKKLRDLIWAPARVEAMDGTVGEVFIPALYARSGEHASDQIKLGRMTEWIALSEDLARGAGLRTFLVDDEERALFEIRDLEFDVSPDAAPEKDDEPEVASEG